MIEIAVHVIDRYANANTFCLRDPANLRQNEFFYRIEIWRLPAFRIPARGFAMQLMASLNHSVSLKFFANRHLMADDSSRLHKVSVMGDGLR
jgi:hypothetical protein